MQSYHVEDKNSGDIASEYPHDPPDGELSLQEYLEAKLSAGYEFAGVIMAGSFSSWRFIFRVVAK